MNFHTVKEFSARRRLPSLGWIKGGVREIKKDGTFRLREVDYFVVPPEVAKKYGEKPKELDVMFPCEEREIFFPQALSWRSQLGLRCQGNGERAIKRCGDLLPEEREQLDEIPEDPNLLVEVSCPCPREGKECRITGRLFLILPLISMGGVYEFSTSSSENVITVNSYVDYLRTLYTTERNPQGRVSWIPLKLRKVPRKLSYLDDEGQKRTKIHYLWQFDLPYSMEEVIEHRKSFDSVPKLAIAIPKESYEIQLKEGQEKEKTQQAKLHEENAETERKRLLAKIHIMKEKLVKLIDLDENWWKDHLLAKWGRSSSAELNLTELKEELAFLSNEVNVALKMTAEGHQSRETEN